MEIAKNTALIDAAAGHVNGKIHNPITMIASADKMLIIISSIEPINACNV